MSIEAWCEQVPDFTGTTPVALISALMCSIVKLETPMFRTFDLGRAIMAFQVSTIDGSRSRYASSFDGCLGWREPFPGTNATGQ